MVVIYADDVDIISRSGKRLEDVYAYFEELSKTIGLRINASKTKYVVTS